MSMKINKTDKDGIDHEYNVLFHCSLFCRKTEEVSETFHVCVQHHKKAITLDTKPQRTTNKTKIIELRKWHSYHLLRRFKLLGYVFTLVHIICINVFHFKSIEKYKTAAFKLTK